MRTKKSITTFSLSFLDIMCCGFGAVILIFLIINHASQTQSKSIYIDMMAEITFLEEDIEEGKQGLVRLRNTLSETDQKWVDAQGLAKQLQQENDYYRDQLADENTSHTQDIRQISLLSDSIKAIETKLKQLRKDHKKNSGINSRSFIGDGERQYLTGLKLGGDRVLILLDSSASMLASNIVNIIRLRNMSDQIKQNAEKWKRAVATVKWLVAQLPASSQYQLYSFNRTVTPALANTRDKWLNVGNKAQLEDAIKALQKWVPSGGTNLDTAFLSILDFSVLPDNVFILTDGLPTLGEKTSKKSTISGKGRVKLFEQAVSQLPNSVPFNIILFPLEGDPMAASLYWQLAQHTAGAFISPSRDWP